MAEPVTDMMREDGRRGARSMVSGAAFGFLSLAILPLVAGALLRWRALAPGEWIWLAAFVAAMAIRMPHVRRNGANAVRRPDAGGALPALLLLIPMLLPLVQLATGGLSAFDYRLPFAAVIIGGLLQIPYLWLFHRAHADLRRNWSPGLEIREGHELVVHGVYGRIRHPMYAAVLLSALAQPLLVQNWLAGPPVLAAACVFCFLRVPAEERMMAAHFGAAYAAYSEKTGRLLPLRRHG